MKSWTLLVLLAVAAAICLVNADSPAPLGPPTMRPSQLATAGGASTRKGGDGHDGSGAPQPHPTAGAAPAPLGPPSIRPSQLSTAGGASTRKGGDGHDGSGAPPHIPIMRVGAAAPLPPSPASDAAPASTPAAAVVATAPTPAPVTVQVDDGAPVTFVADACSAMETSSVAISPIAKLKQRVERVDQSMLELPGVGGACGNGGRCVDLHSSCAAGSSIVWGQCAAGVAKCCQPAHGAAKPAAPATPSPTPSAPAAPSAPVSSGNKIPSGPEWVQQFRGTNSLDDLSASYGPKARAFIGALRAAGATVTIAATYRPMERSYLMYNAWRVALGTVNPNAVPTYPGVNIDWSHGGNRVAARSAAQRMCSAYGINWASKRQKVAPAGSSRHNYRGAVDMNISGYVGKSIANPRGAKVRVNSFSQLVALGAQYGVKYFSGENMHWSDTGH